MTGIAGELPRLMLVTDRRRARSGEGIDAIAEAVAAGLRLIQVREKDLGPALEDFVVRLEAALPPDAAVRIVVNGAPELARQHRLGLHLPADAPTPAAPLPRPLGRSAHDEREVARAHADGVDYLVAGTVFATDSKPGRGGCGIDGLRRLVTAAGDVPVYAIGGIDARRIASVRAAGAHGVAVCGAILGAADPAAATRELVTALAATVTVRSGEVRADE